MSRPALPAAMLALLVVAAATPSGVATPGSGSNDGYCMDRSCPYYDIPVELHVLIDHPVMPDREAGGTCYPIQGTGSRPAVVVYPVLNMIVVNNCIFKDGLFEDGPIVATVRDDARYETPSSVTLTPDGSTQEETAERVACTAMGASSSARARVQLYSGMDMYDLDACSIDWSSMSTGSLHAYLTVSPIGA